MADIFDELLGSELSLMFFISITVWFIIFLYLYYTNNRVKKLNLELESLKED
ncbi:MAG: CcmD family protein [Candidatus Hodarchaeales archaeon]|jgi:CcmD family protein